jgi:SHS2 domain-containing protein
MLPYKEFEHTADVGVEIYGSTLEDLFKNAGYAFFDTIVDATTISPNITRTVSISGADVETLLMNWLRELLFLFSVNQEVYGEFELLQDTFCTPEQDESCTPEQNKFYTPEKQNKFYIPATLEVRVKGEPLDLKKHHFHTEIKAVTYHQFTVFNENGIWKARVIFDV